MLLLHFCLFCHCECFCCKYSQKCIFYCLGNCKCTSCPVCPVPKSACCNGAVMSCGTNTVIDWLIDIHSVFVSLPAATLTFDFWPQNPIITSMNPNALNTPKWPWLGEIPFIIFWDMVLIFWTHRLIHRRTHQKHKHRMPPWHWRFSVAEANKNIKSF